MPNFEDRKQFDGIPATEKIDLLETYFHLLSMFFIYFKYVFVYIVRNPEYSIKLDQNFF